VLPALRRFLSRREHLFFPALPSAHIRQSFLEVRQQVLLVRGDMDGFAFPASVPTHRVNSSGEADTRLPLRSTGIPDSCQRCATARVCPRNFAIALQPWRRPESSTAFFLVLGLACDLGFDFGLGMNLRDLRPFSRRFRLTLVSVELLLRLALEHRRFDGVLFQKPPAKRYSDSVVRRRSE